MYSNIKDPDHLGWKVYSSPQSSNLKITDACRIAFADKLKIVVCELLKIDQVENPSSVHPLIKITEQMTSKQWVEKGYLDLLKDIPPEEVNLSTLNGKSVRRWLIDYGWNLKEVHGLSYFKDLVAEDVKQLTTSVIITDTRYPYEMFTDSITIRLFRSDVQNGVWTHINAITFFVRAMKISTFSKRFNLCIKNIFVTDHL